MICVVRRIILSALTLLFVPVAVSDVSEVNGDQASVVELSVFDHPFPIPSGYTLMFGDQSGDLRPKMILRCGVENPCDYQITELINYNPEYSVGLYVGEYDVNMENKITASRFYTILSEKTQFGLRIVRYSQTRELSPGSKVEIHSALITDNEAYVYVVTAEASVLEAIISYYGKYNNLVADSIDGQQ